MRVREALLLTLAWSVAVHAQETAGRSLAGFRRAATAIVGLPQVGPLEQVRKLAARAWGRRCFGDGRKRAELGFAVRFDCTL